MTMAELCAEANRLFSEEQRLMKLDDFTVPFGTVCYKHARMEYVKVDGTKSIYEYTYPHVRIDGVQTYVKKADRRLVEILEVRKQLAEVRRRLEYVLAEIRAKRPASQRPDVERLREMWGLEMERIEQNRKKHPSPEIANITNCGDKVKSRGECIVGNILEEAGFISEYEPPVYTGNGAYRLPDFQAHGMNGRFYIELLGMTDNEEYRRKNAAKLQEYRRLGIKTGKNLIIFENKGKGFDSQKIREVLQKAAAGDLPKRVVRI